MKKLLSALFAAIFLAQAAIADGIPPIPPPAPSAGSGGITVGAVITGCGAGQFVYNNAGAVGCQAGAGGITGPGTTVSGNLVTWNSTTGTAIADSGISFTSGTFSYPNTINIIAGNSGAGGLYIATNNTYQWGFVGAGFTPQSSNNNTIGTPTAWLLGLYGKNYYVEGASTGYSQIVSANNSISNYSFTLPNVTANDTFALLGFGQTFSGANTFSGAVTNSGTTSFTGVAPTAPAANTTMLLSGTTTPTIPGATSGLVWVGGQYTLPTLSTNGTGAIQTSAAGGMIFQGKGSTYNFMFYNGTTAGAALDAGGGWYARIFYNLVNAHMYASGGAPTYMSGFGSSAAMGTVNGTWKFDIAITTGTGNTGQVGLPTAFTDWNCFANSKSNPTTIRVVQTGFANNSATFAPYTLAGVLSAWASSDTIAISCFAN